MQACPKCGSSAPDDAKTCSICFAALGGAEPARTPSAPAPEHGPEASTSGFSPLGADVSVPKEEEYMPMVGIPGVDNIPKDAPPVYGQPAAPPPRGLGGMPARTTLGGDVIQEDTAPHNYGQPVGGAPMGPNSMRQGAPPPAGARRSTVHARSASAESTRSGFPVALVAVLLLLLAGGGAFGYWYWQKQQAPARAADQFFSAFQKKDWKTVYQMVELPAEQKAAMNEQMFTSVMAMVGNMITLKSYKIGEVKTEGETATVKVTATASMPAMMGQPAGEKSSTNDLPLRLVGGKWKVDATSGRGGMPGLGSMGGMGAPGGR